MMPSVRPAVDRCYPEAKPIIRFGANQMDDRYALWLGTGDRLVTPWMPSIESAYKVAFDSLPVTMRFI